MDGVLLSDESQTKTKDKQICWFTAILEQASRMVWILFDQKKGFDNNLNPTKLPNT